MQNTGTGTGMSTSFWMSGESEGLNDVSPFQSGEFAYSQTSPLPPSPPDSDSEMKSSPSSFQSTTSSYDVLNFSLNSNEYIRGKRPSLISLVL